LNESSAAAFAALEQRELIEPAPGNDGKNGFIVLTPEGVEAAKQ
jgi:hypothetical protein